MTAKPAWLLIIAGLAVVGIVVVWLLAPSIKVTSVKMACAQGNSSAVPETFTLAIVGLSHDEVARPRARRDCGRSLQVVRSRALLDLGNENRCL